MDEANRLQNLAQTCARFTPERNRKGFRWPEEIKHEVLSTLKTGVSIPTIARATGIRNKTIWHWKSQNTLSKAKRDHFKELTIQQPKPKAQSSLLEAVIKSQSHEMHISGLGIEDVVCLAEKVFGK